MSRVWLLHDIFLPSLPFKVYLCLVFTLNALSPYLSGKLQVSTTIIKMIPILAMAIIGSLIGLFNENSSVLIIKAFKLES